MTAETSLAKALRILDLLEEAETDPVSFETLHARLGFTRSTLYRYLKTLQDAGLAAAFHDRGFTLGPRVAELDYRMRLSDPLIAAARPVMAELAASLPGIALLCRRYRDRVLCVHQDGSLGPALRSTYERGLAMPLFRGAASRVILAHLPSSSIARLQARHAAGFAEAGLGDTPTAARAALHSIRRRGWDMTSGQVTPGVTGVAAPVLDGRGAILGSLSVTLAGAGLEEAEAGRIAARIVDGARRIAELAAI
jgi:DNA-binding IclR family transcriptional regulator